MSLSLYEIIEASANAALDLQRSDGAMPSGHNGPYQNEETPVRNTSHWLITFAKAYEITGQTKFKEAVRRATSYLCSREARPVEKSFWHRKSPTKDTCNGLIGQAWTIEALAVAADALDFKEAAQVAEEVFLLHPFYPQLALWERVNADGMHVGIDLTFNHQLWYAAAGALLSQFSESTEVETRTRRFLSTLNDTLRIHSSGLIRHLIVPRWSWKQLAMSTINRIRRFAFSAEERRQFWLKEIGYHSFNLYGFGVLKKCYPSHDIWNNSKLCESIRYIIKDEYRENISCSPYSYSYNPPGFEIPFVVKAFNESDIIGDKFSVLSQKYMNRQIEHSYDSNKKMMTNEYDTNTHSARLYEATRLSNMNVNI